MIFFDHGQCRVAGSRLFVREDRFDEVVNGVAEIAKGIKLGPPHGVRCRSCQRKVTVLIVLAHANGQEIAGLGIPVASGGRRRADGGLPTLRRGAVVVTGTSPTARQRELGTRLRGLRNEHNLTVEDVAERLLCSATKISRLETGARRPSLRDVRDLCGIYEVDASTSAELMSLAKEARAAGWWTQYDDLNLDPLIGLEDAAATITCYSMFYMPGLLQTREYAQGIISIVAPKMDPRVVQQRVDARLRRQQLLSRDSRPRYNVLLDENVIRRGVGNPELIAAQLEKVLETINAGRAVVQVIPFSAGAYATADGYFVLLEFEGRADLWPVVYIEGLAGNQYLDRKGDIARYRECIDYLKARALSPQESESLIAKARAEYTGR